MRLDKTNFKFHRINSLHAILLDIWTPWQSVLYFFYFYVFNIRHKTTIFHHRRLHINLTPKRACLAIIRQNDQTSGAHEKQATSEARFVTGNTDVFDVACTSFVGCKRPNEDVAFVYVQMTVAHCIDKVSKWQMEWEHINLTGWQNGLVQTQRL